MGRLPITFGQRRGSTGNYRPERFRPTERTTAQDPRLQLNTDTTTPDFTDDFQQKRTYMPRQRRGDRPAAFRSMSPKPRY